MTRVRVCLFLVCSLIASRPALAAPGAALPLLPSGEVTDTTIAFSWQSAPESTWYLFWLGKGTPTAFVMEQWYTAEQAGCANGGVCTITLTPPIGAGSYVWFVQTWGAGATGPWSTGKVFVMRNRTPGWSAVLPDARRFTLVMDNFAVLDNETGLVWDRQPSTAGYVWTNASCMARQANNRYGWRRPTIAELASLIDDSQNSNLPSGHPFILGNSALQLRFWSDTTSLTEPTHAVLVWFDLVGPIIADDKTDTARNWCVRGPAGTL